MERHCLALDLKNDNSLIKEYDDYHKNVWPEVLASLKDSGITHMEIYRTGNRLFMVLEVDSTFSFSKKAQMDAKNIKVQEWEKLMWNYQEALPTAKPGEKWSLMEKVFQL